MKAVHEDLIRQRAYEIWEISGRPSGLDKQHWEQAEQELLTASATRSQPAEDAAKHLGQEPVARTTAGRAPERAEDTRPR